MTNAFILPRVGDIYVFARDSKQERCIIARITQNTYAMISIESGNRFRNPVDSPAEVLDDWSDVVLESFIKDGKRISALAATALASAESSTLYSVVEMRVKGVFDEGGDVEADFVVCDEHSRRALKVTNVPGLDSIHAARVITEDNDYFVDPKKKVFALWARA